MVSVDAAPQTFASVVVESVVGSFAAPHWSRDRLLMMTWLGYSMFVLMLVVPTELDFVKGALLAIILGASTVEALRKRALSVTPRVQAWTLFYCNLGVAYAWWGTMNGGEGAVRSLTVYCLWPLVYLALINGLGPIQLRHLIRLIVIGTLAVELHVLLLVASANRWIGWKVPRLPVDASVTVQAGVIEYSTTSFATLLFGVPFCVAALFVFRRGDAIDRRLLWTAATVGGAVALLSGRRALQAVTVLAPVIAIVYASFHPGSIRARRPVVLAGAATAVVIGLASRLQVEGQAMLRTFLLGFGSHEYGATVRRDQFTHLFEGWSARPFFGWGLGTSAQNAIRSLTHPWSYELSYVALLFHVGIVGVALYAIGFGWIVVRGVEEIRRGTEHGRHLVAILSGMTAFLLATATNPYLEKFDYLWVVFMPIAAIDIATRTRLHTSSSTDVALELEDDPGSHTPGLERIRDRADLRAKAGARGPRVPARGEIGRPAS